MIELSIYYHSLGTILSPEEGAPFPHLLRGTARAGSGAVAPPAAWGPLCVVMVQVDMLGPVGTSRTAGVRRCKGVAGSGIQGPFRSSTSELRANERLGLGSLLVSRAGHPGLEAPLLP